MKYLRLFEEYFNEGPQPGDAEYHYPKQDQNEDEMNPQEIKDMWHNLAIDGIGDIKDCYPREICQRLENEGYIEEDANYSWRFTQEGNEKFPNAESLISYLDNSEASYSMLDIDSETPYMRGNETDGG